MNDITNIEQNTGPTLLTRDQILREDKMPTEIVDVPEWGGAVKLGAISANERDELDQLAMKFNADGSRETHIKTKRCMLVAMCLVDQNGKRLLGRGEWPTFGKGKDPRVIDRLFKACQRLNGLDKEEAEAAEGN